MPQRIRIEIVSNEIGDVTVHCEGGNQALLYGLLEVAKDIVRAQALAKQLAVSPVRLPLSGLRLHE